ncbi:hypothetical protein VE03_03940 [Pseudogymnoascus sp. 23342-1-I1]|nr:hypothetical protein VE03_03940 [Pseudogymnoascus sp. 23342-1-I1]
MVQYRDSYKRDMADPQTDWAQLPRLACVVRDAAPTRRALGRRLPGDRDGCGRSLGSMLAKGIILKLCAPGPLRLIISLTSASACWETLKDMYGPSLRRLPDMLEAFMSYAPPAGKRVLDMATDLNHLQQDIEEVCPEERPTDLMKKVVLVRAAGEVLRETKMEDVVRFRVKDLVFEEAFQDLMICEGEMEDHKKAVSLRGKNRGGQKKGNGRK